MHTRPESVSNPFSDKVFHKRMCKPVLYPVKEGSVYSFRKQIAVVTVLLFVAFINASSQRALADGCNQEARDSSTILSQGNLQSCGNTAWDLVASFAGTAFDEGEYDATGQCTGNFTTCDCGHAGANFVSPTKSFVSYDVDDGDGEYTVVWYWDIFNYTGTHLNSCSEGSGECDTTGYSGEIVSDYDDTNAGYDSQDFSCVQ